MTFTYSGNPSSSTRDLVRFLISDTNAATAYFQNEELDYLITTWGNAYTAAIEAVRVVMGREAEGASTSKKVADLTLTTNSGSSVAKWQRLIKELETARWNLYPAAPVVNPNAILPTDEGIVEGEGTDFYVGQMDNNT